MFQSEVMGILNTDWTVKMYDYSKFIMANYKSVILLATEW